MNTIDDIQENEIEKITPWKKLVSKNFNPISKLDKLKKMN